MTVEDDSDDVEAEETWWVEIDVLADSVFVVTCPVVNDGCVDTLDFVVVQIGVGVVQIGVVVVVVGLVVVGGPQRVVLVLRQSVSQGKHPPGLSV